MKKNWVAVSVLLLAMFIPVVAGCSQIPWNDDNQNAQVNPENIRFFARMASRITLQEANASAEDVEIVKTYLIAVKDLLSVVEAEPDFASARNLVHSYLPEKYQLYGMSMIDIIERYILSLQIDLSENQELVVSLIEAAIDGALDSVDEISGAV